MTLIVPGDIRSNVNIAANQAYRTIEGDPEWIYGPDIAHRSSVCGWVTTLMLRQLVAFGYDVQQEIRRGQVINEHSYLLIEPRDMGIVADATWQQFVSRDVWTPELPKVLIGDREDVIEQAKELGVAEKYLPLWEERTTK